MAGLTQEQLGRRVRRNYIPEGQETASELAERARRQQRGLRQGATPNFIPDPTAEPRVHLGREVEHELAMASAERRSANAKQVRWEEAKKAVLRLTPAGAIQIIGDLTKAQQELFLLAEEATQGRSEVLGRFGKVGDKARAIWRGTGDNVSDTPVPVEVVPEPIVEVVSTPKKSPKPRKVKGPQAEAQSVFAEDELAKAFAKASGGDSAEETLDSEPVAEDAQTEE